MFDGIIILYSEKIPISYGWGWSPVGWVFIGLAILGIALLCYCAYKLKRTNINNQGTIFMISCIAPMMFTVGLIGALLKNANYKPKDYVMEYKATISDLTPFTYVMENYDVVDHVGNIWTLRSKKIINEAD